MAKQIKRYKVKVSAKVIWPGDSDPDCYFLEQETTSGKVTEIKREGSILVIKFERGVMEYSGFPFIIDAESIEVAT